MITTRSGRRPRAGTWIVAALFGLLATVLAAAPAAAASLPAHVAAAPAAPGTIPAHVAAQQGWVDVTDEPSGVTVALPAAAAPVAVPYGRGYAPKGADIGFAVVDVPSALTPDLSDLLDTVAPGFGVTVIDSRATEVGGRRALDAEVAVDTAGVRGTALVRAVVTDGHVVVLVTAAEPGDAAAADRHRRLLAGARFA